MGILTVLLVSVVVLVIWAVAIYNRLVRLAMLADNAWSDVDVQLKRRYDLVPNLVETVKGYAAHERNTLEAVIRARNAALAAQNPEQRIEAENMLTDALRQIFALAEAYPDLKANQNFLALQQELSAIEQDIANARRYYNAVVRDYNTRLASIPDGLIAALVGFRPRNFFIAEDEARETPQVRF
ncbi:MAG: LemA family protein [Armatimonadetes bacterium]|nr:LemA family protein [Armatimonadota bacterium]MCX7966951.1 LemA family protein [Armatimonadota bacterium]MDW8142967.1 LemA family protein [Armatimonadota bacterium]